MVESGVLCTNADVVNKAGANVAAAAITEAFTNNTILQVEALMSSVARSDLRGLVGGVVWTAGGDEFLAGICSDGAAIYSIQYDMSGFTSRTEAEDMINILRDSFLRGLSLLRDNKVIDWLTGDVNEP